MRRVFDIAEYIFNLILVENPAFENLPYRSPDTLDHLKKGCIEFIKNHTNNKYNELKEISINDDEWKEIGKILSENIVYKKVINQGTELSSIDFESNFLMLSDEILSHFCGPKIIVSKVLGNFVRIKNQDKKVTKRFYLATRFEPKNPAEKSGKQNMINLAKVTHKFTEGVKNSLYFEKDQKVYNVANLEEFLVTASDFKESKVTLKSVKSNYFLNNVATFMYRSYMFDIIDSNRWGEVIRINALLGIRVEKIEEIMKDSDWEYDGSEEWGIWARTIKDHKCKVVDIVGKHAIVNFIGSDLADFQRFNFRIDIDYLIGNKSEKLKNLGLSNPLGNLTPNSGGKTKEEEEEIMEKEDIKSGPYELDNYLGKIVKIVNYGPRYDDEYGRVYKINNNNGKIYIAFNKEKCYFRASKHKENIVIIGNMIMSNF